MNRLATAMQDIGKPCSGIGRPVCQVEIGWTAGNKQVQALKS